MSFADTWHERCWIQLPVRAASFGPAAMMTATDGHWVSSFGRATSLLTPALAFIGLIQGWRHFGFDVTMTESTSLIVALLVLGVIGTQFAGAFLVGYALGDFFLFNFSWQADSDTNFLLEFVYNVWYDRVPLLAYYLLLCVLAIGVPVAARGLVATLADRIQGPVGFQLVVGAVLSAVSLFILTRFWTAAAPHVVRPLFTWSAPDLFGFRSSSPPLDAIAPVQDNPTVPRLGALAVLLRFGLVYQLSRWPAGQTRVEELEIEFGNALLDNGPIAPPTQRRLILQSAGGALTGLLLLLGLFGGLLAPVVLGISFFALRLAKNDVIPFPTKRWREVVGQIPAVLRFAVGLLIINGISRTVVGLEFRDNPDSFDFLLWPMIAAMAVLTILLPVDRNPEESVLSPVEVEQP